MSIRRPLTFFLICAFIVTAVSFVPAFTAGAEGGSPDAPENPMATPMEGSIYLSWSPPMNPGNSSIIAYIIYRGESPGSEGYYQETSSTSLEDFGIEAGRTYYYQVSARNNEGEGPMSIEISASISIPTWAVSGRVTDRDSGDGIDGAYLRFEEQGPQQGSFDSWTDDSGSYNIELGEGNYRVRVEADGYDTIEDNIYVNGQQTMNFEFEEKGGDSGDFNLSDILGIDQDKVQSFVITAAVIAGAVFSILPLMLIIANILLLIILIRTGKVRKELRARNEQDGIFLSKRRKRKHEEKSKEKKTTSPPKKEEKKKVEIEEKEEDEKED